MSSDLRNSLIHDFRNKLSERPIIGFFSKTEDPAFVEAAGYGGFDYIIIDMEHGPNSIRSAQNLIRAAELSGMASIIRVKEGQNSYISEAFDIGAVGVQIPKINSAQEIKQALEFARYNPQGNRGVCRFVRAADYSSKDKFEYFKNANENIIIIQIEGTKGIENLEEILGVDGIDVVFIGPYDLSQSLGIPGQTRHPQVLKKMQEIISVCERRGIAVGIFVESVEEAREWISIGVKYVSYSVDVGIFFEKSKEITQEILNGMTT